MASTGASPVDAGSTPTDAHARTVASAGSPRRSLATASTAAPSLAPQALPAVIENPSISGCNGLSDGQLLDAGVAARVLVDLEQPVRRLDRDDLLLEAPLVDGLDRLAVRPQRPLVHLLAAHAGLDRGVPADGDRHVHVGRIGPVGVGGRKPVDHLAVDASALNRGDVDAEFTPPAITSWSMPARMLAAALCTAAWPAAQCRFWRQPRHRGQPGSDRGMTCDRRRRRRAPRPG